MLPFEVLLQGILKTTS